MVLADQVEAVSGGKDVMERMCRGGAGWLDGRGGVTGALLETDEAPSAALILTAPLSLVSA